MSIQPAQVYHLTLYLFMFYMCLGEYNLGVHIPTKAGLLVFSTLTSFHTTYPKLLP